LAGLSHHGLPHLDHRLACDLTNRLEHGLLINGLLAKFLRLGGSLKLPRWLAAVTRLILIARLKFTRLEIARLLIAGKPRATVATIVAAIPIIPIIPIVIAAILAIGRRLIGSIKLRALRALTPLLPVVTLGAIAPVLPVTPILAVAILIAVTIVPLTIIGGALAVIRRALAITEIRALAVRLADRLRRNTFRRGSETIRQGAEIVVIILVDLNLAGRSHVARLGLRLRQLSRRDQPEVMFGVLQIAFRGDRIAGRLGITRKLEIFLGHMMRRAADFNVRAIGLIGTRERIRAFPIRIATPHALILTWSHRSSLDP
jgi:hypothetical protein